MCFFGILSLDTFGPHTGLLSYGLPKKMGAGPYGYMIKLATTQKSPSVAQMTSVVHAKNHVGKKNFAYKETIRIIFLRVISILISFQGNSPIFDI